jgi:hypothetical protein
LRCPCDTDFRTALGFIPLNLSHHNPLNVLNKLCQKRFLGRPSELSFQRPKDGPKIIPPGHGGVT